MWRHSCQGPLAAVGGSRDQARRALAPRQSAIGEINLPSARGPNELLTTRPAKSPDSVRAQQRKNVQLSSQSVIGEINFFTLRPPDSGRWTRLRGTASCSQNRSCNIPPGRFASLQSNPPGSPTPAALIATTPFD